jgi:ABC-type transport system involved in cytochrome bd biosynthesis fused ATPase/permease subunit
MPKKLLEITPLVEDRLPSVAGLVSAMFAIFAADYFDFGLGWFVGAIAVAWLLGSMVAAYVLASVKRRQAQDQRELESFD